MSGADDPPLLVLTREEKGRVALLLSDHAWLWARGYREGGPHLDLLRRLAHWLMKEPALEEEALRASVERTRHPHRAPDHGRRRRRRDAHRARAAPSARSRSPRSSPGLFTALTPSREMGLHTLRSGDLVAFVSIGPANPRELVDVFSDTEALRPIAEATGGSVRRVAGEAGEDIAVPRIQPVRVRIAPRRRRLDRHPPERQRHRARRLGVPAGARPPRPRAPRGGDARGLAGGGATEGLNGARRAATFAFAAWGDSNEHDDVGCSSRRSAERRARRIGAGRPVQPVLVRPSGGLRLAAALVIFAAIGETNYSSTFTSIGRSRPRRG